MEDPNAIGILHCKSVGSGWVIFYKNVTPDLGLVIDTDENIVNVKVVAIYPLLDVGPGLYGRMCADYHLGVVSTPHSIQGKKVRVGRNDLVDLGMLEKLPDTVIEIVSPIAICRTDILCPLVVDQGSCEIL